MKNIVLITGYSLLTAFFLCTPPLCAQEKVLDRMTRSEARQEILRHTEIKDHVTFYHSNDKDIYVVYDLASSGNKEKMLQGKTILLGILDAFESTRNQSRPLEVSFFAREKFFDAIRILKENKLMDAELRQQSESLVSQMSFCEERGPNNRAANYAMGALAAARLFPKHKDAKLWKAYAEVCTWYGAVRFASESKNKELSRQLQERFDYLCTAEKDFLPIKNHVDLNMFGCLPLELYQITKKIQYLDLGISYADTQWELPAEASAEEKRWADKGLSWQTRLWIDDMYMITILQSQAYRATGNRKYIDRTARSMAVYLDELQRPNGLFYHAPDVPFLWGRGNGWMAAGMAELLKVLPKDNPDRPRILQGYLDMMKSLKQYQAENGMWNQLIDAPDCWNETSGTAMFTYAMITGVKQGWLKAREYAPAVRKAWLSLVSYINENGDVTEVCSGTNKRNNRQYYYDRPKKTGDYHGQAPVLWCAFALMENK